MLVMMIYGPALNYLEATDCGRRSRLAEREQREQKRRAYLR